MRGEHETIMTASQAGASHEAGEASAEPSVAREAGLAEILDDAWNALEASLVRYRGEPVGTVAADADDSGLNYGQCFTRDFAVSAAAFLAKGEYAVVRNFLRVLSRLQARDHHLDCFEPGVGLMPASFGVTREGSEETLVADFGQRAIGSVAPVDAALWWLLVLRAYERASGDRELSEDPEVVAAIERILDLYLAPRFEMIPTLLVPDGAFAIDRRMGVYGHPLDVQVLFFGALRAARELLPTEHALQAPLLDRLGLLADHLRRYYWLDADRLNAIYRYGVEQFGRRDRNRFNVYPESMPSWVMPWLLEGGGYFAGNLGPARLDYRYFAFGNLLAVTTGLATEAQARAVADLLDRQRHDLLGSMPMKMVFPAVEGSEWQTATGSDPKNSAWSYHNGGSWPWLMWLLASASRRVGTPQLASDAVASALPRLQRDGWPEYYDGPFGGLVGREARLRQTWSVAGVLAADALLRDPEAEDPFAFPPDTELEDHIARVGDGDRTQGKRPRATAPEDGAESA